MQIRYLEHKLLGFLVFFLGTAHLYSGHAQGFVVGGRKCAADKSCKTDSTAFRDTLSTATAWQWSFGDGRGSNKRNPKHLYQQPGRYAVTLTRTVAGVPQLPVRDSVTIGAIPPIFQKWQRDTMLCPKEIKAGVFLDPYPQGAPAGAKYIWYPKGDTTQRLKIDSSGCYSVTASINGCTYEDRINVKVCLEKTNQEGTKWFFGNNAGIDFQGGANPISTGQVNTIEGASTIANSKGRLLFYTDGQKIFDRDGQPLKFKDSTVVLGGSPLSTQSALIVPQPTCRGCEYLYNVFTTTEINGKKVVSYSVVDMRLNGGKGAVVEANKILHQPSSEQLVSLRNNRDSTYWVVTHDFGTNNFRIFHSTPAGLEQSGVYSLGVAFDAPHKAEGSMKFSPGDSTGKRKLAVVIPGPPKNLVQLYDFNDSSGRLRLESTIVLGNVPPEGKAYGVEFSQDGTKMYVTIQGDGGGKPSRLLQYDISLKDSARIADSRIQIDSSATEIFGALQIAPDNRIYMAKKDGSSLGVIARPNEDSILEVLYRSDGFFLGGKTSQLGLPNFVQNFTQESQGPGFTYADTCSRKPTTFTASPICPPKKDTYVWDFGDGSSSTSQQTEVKHTYKKGGTYKVVLRASNECADTTLTQTVTIIETPEVIDLGKDQDVCQNSLELDAKVTAKNYIWLRNGVPIGRAQKQTITNSGTFVVIAFNQECFSADTVNITLRRPPAFRLGADTTLCQGTNFQLNAAGPSWNQFAWNTGATTRNITITQAGTYIVKVSNSSTGCSNGDTVLVVGRPKIVPTAALAGPTGCTTTDGRITVSTTPVGTYNFAWSNAANQPLAATGNQLTNVGEGLYRLKITGTNVCNTDTSYTLRSAANNLRAVPTPRAATCLRPTGGSVSLAVSGGTPNAYIWRNAAGTTVGTAATLTNVGVGTYNVEVTDAGGCKLTLDGIKVDIDRSMMLNIANLGPDRAKCLGDTIRFTPADSASPGNTYLWNTGATTRSIVVNQVGTYRVTVTNTATGCLGTDDAAAAFNPKPTVTVPAPEFVCANVRPFQLTGGTPAGGVWSGRRVDARGFFFPSDSAAALGRNTVTYKATVNGCSNTADRVLFINPAPKFSLGRDTTLCLSNRFVLNVTLANAEIFEWSTGETTRQITPKTSGIYTVKVTAAGCTNSDTVRVNYLPLPDLNITKNQQLCVADGGTVRLSASTTSGNRLLWQHSRETTTQVSVNQAGTYRVRAIDPNQCFREDTARVLDFCEPRLFVPEAFSPNNDGINDLLDVKAAHISDFSLRVYNRWGEVVFYTTELDRRWDGTYRGAAYPPMAYPYTISYRGRYYPNLPLSVKRGVVVLIR